MILEKVNIFLIICAFVVFQLAAFFLLDLRIKLNERIFEKNIRTVIDEQFANYRDDLIELRSQFERIKVRQIRSTLTDFDDSRQNNGLKDANVEFFNPKLRPELEKKDEKSTSKNSAPNGDNWVWLTSYSRIPVSRFCITRQIQT